jgi:hypothetical protein
MIYQNIKSIIVVALASSVIMGCDRSENAYERTRLLPQKEEGLGRRPLAPRAEGELHESKIYESTLKEIPVIFRVPEECRVSAYGHAQKVYSTLHLVRRKADGSYPINMSLTYWAERDPLDFTVYYEKRMNRLMKYPGHTSFETEETKVGEHLIRLVECSYDLIFPPRQKNPKTIHIIEKWGYFRENGRLYEWKLLCLTEEADLANKLFNEIIHSLNFININ